jgi:CubicO group peptidase (beta-lactamase class C family)
MMHAIALLIVGGTLLAADLLCNDAAHAQGAAEQSWPTREWPTSSPEDQGIDSADLARLVAFGATRSFDSLLIARHGRIVLDAYYAPYTAEIPHAINSATKAVIGTLIAIAHKDGLLDKLDHPMLDFFSDRSIANVDERKRAITVQNLLDMTSGLDWEEGAEGGREQSLIDIGRSRDWTQFILDRPMAHRPGEIFYYDSGNPDLLSAIITKLTGERAADYAQTKLFDPLGIERPFWRRDPQGLTMGAGGLALRPRDMARIGYLYLRRGAWAGQQLLPPQWIDAVSRATIPMNLKVDPSLHYSNLFWVIPEKHVYMAVGYHCQLIMVFPPSDVVAAVTARDFCPFGRLADLNSGAVRSEAAIPANPEAADRLAKAIRDIATEKPTTIGATPALAATISGKTYNFPDSPLGIKSVALFLSETDPHYQVEVYVHGPVESSIMLDGPIGLDGLYRKGRPGAFSIPAAKGSWLNERTFAIDFQYVGAGEQRKWSLRFDGDKVMLSGKGKDGSDISIDAAPRG